jgi:hypothetical protein
MLGSLVASLTAVTLAGASVATAATRPEGAPATCGNQSAAAFAKRAENLVVGPLMLAGARRYTSPEAVARLKGNKFPLVVLAGHRVTVEVPRSVRRSTSLLYADDKWERSGDGERRVEQGHRVVAFRACSSDRADSTLDGRPATFWSGFVVTTVPRCLTLRVWVDAATTPRRARIPLGKRCH